MPVRNPARIIFKCGAVCLTGDIEDASRYNSLMLPFIFNRGDIVIPTFFTMVMLGVLATTFLLYFRAPKLGFSQVVTLDFGIIGAITGILGARVFHIVAEAWWFYAADWTRIFEFWRGGFVSYGAYIGGLLGVYAYLKIRKLPILSHMDFVATAIPFMVIFIRLGCIGTGCCFGKPTDFFIHLVFPGPAVDGGAPSGVPLHATQIYDLLNGVFLLGFLNWFYPRRKFDGQIVLLLFMLYAAIRFMIEFLRGDVERGVYYGGAISTAQITGIVVIAVGGVVYAVLRRRSFPKESF